MAIHKQAHILVVDDEQRVRSVLKKYLAEEGFRVTDAADGDGVRATFGREAVDLVLLDLMIPGEDGLSLTRYIRQRSNTPIIMITGKNDLIDRVAGLEAGADDYITKPFQLREVLARIRTILRRAHPEPDAGSDTADIAAAHETFLFEGWRLDCARRELRAEGGVNVPLTTAEFDLLTTFVQHPNRVLSREQLMDLVKGRQWSAYDRAIDTQVARLRSKIERNPNSPELIKTVRGAGYLFAGKVTAP